MTPLIMRKMPTAQSSAQIEELTPAEAQVIPTAETKVISIAEAQAISIIEQFAHAPKSERRRIFKQLREILASNQEILSKIERRIKDKFKDDV